MTFGLYECLRAVGLQRHYARFTSAGICHTAHLSVLTTEDYSQLGVCTIEEKNRLFDLVQMIKSIDLESLLFDNEFDFGNPAEDTRDGENEARVGRLCVRKQLDFENLAHQQKLASRPEETLDVNASSNTNTRRPDEKASATSEHLHQGGPVVCNCKENRYKSSVSSHPSDHHTTENLKPDIAGGPSMFNFTDRLPSRCVALNKPKLRPTTASSDTSDSRIFGHKNKRGLLRKKSFCPDWERNGSIGHTVKQIPVYEAKRTAGYNYGLPLSVPASPHKKRVREQRISVCVRKRPLTRVEKRRKEADVVTNPSGACVIVHDSKEAVDLTQYTLQHKFYFDYVFGEESLNEEVYRSTAYPLVQHMLNGGSATCFAYGQTGAGKTHTMLGSPPSRPGLYTLAVQDIFTYLSSTHTHSSMKVYVSFFEIYCGQLYDLLDHRKRLFAREDAMKVVHISGLHEVKVESVKSVLEVIQCGTEVRTQGMSGVNPFSSRSHALLRIQLRDPNQQIAGRMWFVDLAGSERASDTKEPNRQSRLEGAEINQSLLALKECIRSLDKEQSHTPFRQSKLTQVLKDSFVGNSMTCMIANISPGHTATEHTLNTLRYADRVKELKGQGGLRGRKLSKTISSQQHNLSNSSTSSTGDSIRGKGVPKKTKSGRQNEDIGLTAFTMKLLQRDAILCSTPKNSRWGVEAKAMDKKQTGFESITSLRSLFGPGDKKDESKKSCAAKSTKVDNKTCLETDRYSTCEQSVPAGSTWKQPTDKQHFSGVLQKDRLPYVHNLSQTLRESDLNQSKKTKQKRSMKEDNGEDRKFIELRKQVEMSRDVTCASEGNMDITARNTEEERKMHLRKYHQQLQQFVPSYTPSSVSLFSPSTLSSVSSSAASTSFPHSVSSCRGLGDSYSAKGEVRVDCNRGQLPLSSRDVHIQTESSLFYSSNSDADVNLDDNDCAPEDWMSFQQSTKAKCKQDIGTNRLKDATGEEGIRSCDNKPAGMKSQQRRLAWGGPQETDPANRVTGALVTNIESQMCYSYDSEDRREVGVEGLDASHAPADEAQCSEQEDKERRYVVQQLSNNSSLIVQSSSLFSPPQLETQSQQAPAERPLSPAHQHTNTSLNLGKLTNTSLEYIRTKCNDSLVPLPLQNTSETVNTRVSFETSSPLSKPITHCDFRTPPHKQCENSSHTKNVKTSILPQDDAESLSSIVDPLSVSLLHVDHDATTNSFRQGGESYNSCSRFEDDSRNCSLRKVEDDCQTFGDNMWKVADCKDGDFHLSFLELPQIKPHVPTESVTTSTQAERSGMCRIDRTEPAEESYQGHETTPPLGNKDPGNPLTGITCASMQTPTVPHTDKQSPNTGSPCLNKIMMRKMAGQSVDSDMEKYPPSIRALGERVSGQVNAKPSKFHGKISNHSRQSDVSLQPSDTVGLKAQDHSSNLLRPSTSQCTLDDLDDDKWCVVEAHWEQLKEMEALCREEGMLLCQQPDMAFGEYIQKLVEIMERKADCVHNMQVQLQPYLNTIQRYYFHQHGQHNHNSLT